MNVEGYIDIVDDFGSIVGWARNHDNELSCAVQVFQDDTLIAEAVADEFRRDLFRDQVGHGHYGFRANILHDLPVRSALKLVDMRSGCLLNPNDATIYTTQQSKRIKFIQLERLYAPRPSWEEGDLIENIAVLRLQDNLRSMHPLRFLDVIYQYLLGRWSDDPARAECVDRLHNGSLHPDDLFVSILTSPERRSNGRPLVGPFHYSFPFDLRKNFVP